MPYIGKQPANVPVTADDIPANSIDASKIIDGAITIADIADDAVTADKLANSINSAIAANTAKTGITSGQASAITANTAKTGITSGQASAITANTAKVTNSTSASDLTSGTLPSARLGTITGFTSTGIDDNATSNAITIDASENVALAGASLTMTDGSLKSGVSGTFNINGATGTAGAPAYCTYGFNGDVNTGMYSGTADNVKFATAGTERMRIEGDGVVVYAGQSREFYANGTAANNNTYSFDITHGNDSGSGTVLYIQACHTHHPSYDSILDVWVSRRTNSFTKNDQFRRDSATGGNWQVSYQSNTVTRIQHNGGNYSGGGPYWVRCTWRNN